ncbi:MAG: hypothetical protein KME42_14945 [Tildeniella nuda ZEHNDER 1965/U140]|jgi:hypothetical protein|nr:hypothetical protein [Tildeniella nuda ZEHNDER 1965/U140]
MHLSTELPDRLAQAIADYIQDQPHPTNIPDVLQTALETFLSERGYLSQSRKRLHITPAEHGSGYRNTSIEHDQVLANIDQETSA